MTWQQNMVICQSTAIIFSRSSRNGCIPTTIFSIRELISNGCDAITKLKKLALMGEYEYAGRLQSTRFRSS